MCNCHAYFLDYPERCWDYPKDQVPDRLGMRREALEWAKSFGWEENDDLGQWWTAFTHMFKDGSYKVIGWRFTCPKEMYERMMETRRK